MITPEQQQAIQSMLKENNYQPPTSSAAPDWHTLITGSTPNTTTPPAPPTVGQDLGSDLGNAQQEMVGVASRSGIGGTTKSQSLPETVLQTLGVGAKLGNDVIGTGIKHLTGAMWDVLPQPIKDVVHSETSAILNTPASQAGLNAAKQGMDKYNAWAVKNPRAAENLSAVVNIPTFAAALIGSGAAKAIANPSDTASAIAEGAKSVAQGAKNVGADALDIAKQTPGAIKEGVGSMKQAVTDVTGIGKSADQKAWELVQPNLSVAERKAAVKAGDLATQGPTGKIVQIPKGRNLDMLKTAQPYIQNVKDPIQAVDAMKQGIADEANNLRSGLSQSKSIWNQNELKGAINAVEKPHLLSGDLEKAFDKTVKVVLDKANESDKNLSGLLDVRQNFDKIVEQQYPNLYEGGNMTAIKKAVTDTRAAINDLIESKLPEGKTIDGISFKDSLRKQSLLYDAIDNTASKVGKVGTTKLGRFYGKYKTPINLLVGGTVADKILKNATGIGL